MKQEVVQEKTKPLAADLFDVGFTANPPQEDFGDFFEAPTSKKEVKKEPAKSNLLDEAKDFLDMDDLMKVTSEQQATKSNPTTLYNALYDKPKQYPF